MKELFKLSNEVAKSDNREFSSLYELTKAIAFDAGWTNKGEGIRKRYFRGDLTPRTVKATGVHYTKLDENQNIIWDNALVAKWLIAVRPIINRQLAVITPLKEDFVYIAETLFERVFKSINFDKVVSAGMLHNYIKQSLHSIITEVIYTNGSTTKLSLVNKLKERYNEVARDKAMEKTARRIELAKLNKEMNKVMNITLATPKLTSSIESMSEDEPFEPVDNNDINKDRMDLLVIDLNSKLSNVGKRILEAMLYNSDKFNINKIGKFVKFTETELANQTELREDICRSFKIIKDTLRNSLTTDVQNKYDWTARHCTSNSLDFADQVCAF